MLERLVARVRDRAAIRLWHLLAQLPTVAQQEKLEALLEVPDGARSSHLDRLRRAPSRISGPALVTALHRLDEIREIGIGNLSFDHIPPNRLRALARYGAAASDQAIVQMTPERRTATLVAFAHAFEQIAMDDALDLLDLVISQIVHDAQHHGEKERIRTLHDLDAAALQLWDALQVLLDDSVDIAVVRQQTFAQIPRDQVLEAGAQVVALTRPPDDTYYPELVERYRRVRRFLPTLLSHVAFEGTQAGITRAGGVAISLRLSINATLTCNMHLLDMVPAAWRRLVLPPPRACARSTGVRSVQWNACKIACADAMSLSQKASGGQTHGSYYYKAHNGKR